MALPSQETLNRGGLIPGESSLDDDRASWAKGSSDISTSGAAIVGQSESDNDSGPGPEIMAADTLKGNDVYNAAGDNLGEIEAIMLDVQAGRIAYVVLSFGGFLGFGEKLFAIPWQLLTLDTDRECFVLNVDKERLEKAPGFDKDHWPSMADFDWAQDIHTYYGTRPYWRG